MKTKIFKSIFTASVIAASMTFGAISQAQENGHENEIPDEILYFAGEIQTYIETAKSIPELPEDRMNDAVEELQAIGKRAAEYYFQHLNESLQPMLDKYLGQTLEKNASLENYFIFLGNSFLAQAVQLMDEQAAKEKKIRIRSAIGGSILGLAVGGGYLFVKAKYIAPGAALTLKDYLIASTAVVGFGVGGYVGGNYYARYRLPTNWAVKNAKAFRERYPLGEDFIRDLRGGREGTADLEARMIDIEDSGR